MKTQNMIYALRDNQIVHISDVESGINCNCRCSACDEPLIARKGSKVMHHFAHKSTKNCEYGYQTSLHLAAKDIISKNMIFSVPELYLSLKMCNRRELLEPAAVLTVYKVILEKRLDTIIPDILLETNIGKIIVEIYVTHEIDNEKKKKIKSLNIPTIEIDLSKFDREISPSDLEDTLVNGLDFKNWIYNGKREESYKRFLEVTEKKIAICKNHFWNVYNCPLQKRSWKDFIYADFYRDCLECEFMFGYINHSKTNGEMENIVWCTGKHYISHFSDFSLSLEQRKENYKQRKEEEMYDCITQGICPKCENALLIKHGIHGEFFGCSNYPKCKFTFSYNDK